MTAAARSRRSESRLLAPGMTRSLIVVQETLAAGAAASTAASGGGETATTPVDATHAADDPPGPVLLGDLRRHRGEFALHAGVVRPPWALRRTDRADPVAAADGADADRAADGGVGRQLPAAADSADLHGPGGGRDLRADGAAAGVRGLDGGVVRRLGDLLDPAAADRRDRVEP